MTIIDLRVKKLTKTAQLPKQNHDGDAAVDIYADEDTIIPAQGRATIKTGIAIAFPKGYVLFIKDRSGLAAREGLTSMGGVIDSGYRGEYLIIMHNTTTKDYLVTKGDRIAQGVLLPIPEVRVLETEELDETERGKKGFGSSGK